MAESGASSGTESKDFARTYEAQLNHELEKEVLSSSSYNSDTDELEVLLPSAQNPGVATSATLERGLQVPSNTRYLTSGFSYPDQLFNYSVSESQWSDFTSSVTAAAKMTSNQWTTTVGKGFGTLVAGGIMLGFFSVIPAVVVSQKIRRMTEEDNLQRALEDETGELNRVVRRWNETFFRPRGLLVRIDLPGDADDILMGMMEVSPPPTSRLSLFSRESGDQVQSSHRARLGSLLSSSSHRGSSSSSTTSSTGRGRGTARKSPPSSPRDESQSLSLSIGSDSGSSERPTVSQQAQPRGSMSREKASRRGRIVILPLDPASPPQ